MSLYYGGLAKPVLPELDVFMDVFLVDTFPCIYLKSLAARTYP